MDITGLIPSKTPVGLEELKRRSRSVTQRHRTMLLLVDGRRTAGDVLVLAAAAGVPESCFADLLDLQLVALPAAAPAIVARSEAPAGAPAAAAAAHAVAAHAANRDADGARSSARPGSPVRIVDRAADRQAPLVPTAQAPVPLDAQPPLGVGGEAAAADGAGSVALTAPEPADAIAAPAIGTDAAAPPDPFGATSSSVERDDTAATASQDAASHGADPALQASPSSPPATTTSAAVNVQTLSKIGGDVEVAAQREPAVSVAESLVQPASAPAETQSAMPAQVVPSRPATAALDAPPPKARPRAPDLNPSAPSTTVRAAPEAKTVARQRASVAGAAKPVPPRERAVAAPQSAAERPASLPHKPASVEAFASTIADASDPPPEPRIMRTVDGPLEQAREVLLRAVRMEAPISGQMTLMKLKRVGDRAALEALLAEVELRIARPRRRGEAATTMRRVRRLLDIPANTAFPMTQP